MTRAAVYIRKSRETEGAAHRLEAQRERLPAHARAQGWEPVVYDEGIASAARGCPLPQRDRLAADIRAGRIHVVLAIELSRLSRDASARDYLEWLALCGDHGVRLATPQRIIDPANRNEWFLLFLEGGFSAMEMQAFSARAKEARARAWEQGGHVGGGIPRAYRRTGVPGQLALHPDHAPRVRAVLLAYAQGGMGAALAAARGYAHENTVRKWVSEPGLAWFLARRPSQEHPGTLIPCAWEPLLTPAEAGLIRTRRDQAALTWRQPTGGRRNALLTGLDLLTCAYCGGRVTSTSCRDQRPQSRRRWYYVCRQGAWAGLCPTSRQVRQEALDRAVVTHVLGTLARPDLLAAAWHAAAGRTDTERRDAAALEAAAAAKRGRLVHAIAEGVLTLTDARAAIAELDAELRTVRTRLATLADPAAAPDWHGLAALRHRWDALDHPARRALLTAALDRITLHRTYAILHYAWPRTPDTGPEARIHLPATRNSSQETPGAVAENGKNPEAE